MVGRLLTKAALLLAAAVGPVAMANEPGTEVGKVSKSADLGIGDVSSSTQPLKTESRVKSNPEQARSTRVILITSKDSEACQKEMERLSKPGGVFAAMRSQGWKIGAEPSNHVQIIDEHEAQELVDQLNSTEFPLVACISDKEILRSFRDGCSTPLDPWTFGWLIKGISERPPGTIPEAIRVATTGNYPLRGNHWTVDGVTNPSKELLVSHLRNPTHSPYLQASYKLEDWSTEELRSLHDDLHERYGPSGPAAGYAAAQSGGMSDGIRKGLGK